MASYFKVPTDFTNDRLQFFSQNKKRPADVQGYIRQNHRNYDFIARNKTAIEQEYSDLFGVLTKKNQLLTIDKAQRDEFWLYWYYCSIMLQYYYKTYGKNEKAQELRMVRKQIFKRFKGEPSDSLQNDPSLLEYLATKVRDFFVDLAQTPAHLAKIRSKVAYSNLLRIYWFFSRTTVIKAFVLANQYQFFEKLAKFFGRPIDLDKIINTLEIPTEILKLFSIGFFLSRLFLNTLMTIRHTFMPSAGEEQLAMSYRLKQELFLRHIEMLNDIVWSIINCATNFNEVFQISMPTAGWIVAGFMVFDIALILWRIQIAKWEYESKDKSYDEQISAYRKLIIGTNNDEEIKRYQAQIELLNDQKIELEISWETKKGTLIFVGMAATILVLGFSASMLLASPVLIIPCYAICTLAISMYLSDGAFATFKHKQLVHEQAQRSNFSDQKQLVAYEEYKTARLDFALTLAKNFLLPAVFIATFAICWQAALVLTAVYVGYVILDAYYSDVVKKRKIAELEAPAQLAIEDQTEPRNDKDITLECFAPVAMSMG